MKTVRVKYLKFHPRDAYFPNDVALLKAEKAAERVKDGYVMILTDEEKRPKINPLPEDLPARDILFIEKFDTVDQVKNAR